MGKSKEYFKNTAILLLGKFATQFMSFLLIPLYTNELAVDDYGTVDLLQTYIMLLVPALTLRLDSAAFRFLIDNRMDKLGIKRTISNIMCVLSLLILFTIIIAVILPFWVHIPQYVSTVINIIVLMLSGVMLQFLRGLGNNKGYSIASVITGAITLISNLILILCFDWGAESILVSSIIANIVCCVYVFFSAKVYRFFSAKQLDKELIKTYLSYSLPMVPNAFSWWIVNISDRTIIQIFLGAAFNGIYTISCKFSNLLNGVFTIFNMSWQESASLHINDKDRDEYFSKMINQLFVFFSSIALLILSLLPFIYSIVVGNNYLDSYQFIPILLYASSWHVLINLIGGIYVAKKRTKEIANTTIISAIINIIINIALIGVIGLHAATISTLVSYMVMAIYRAKDCQKYIKLRLNVRAIMVFSAVFVVSSVMYIFNNTLLNIINVLFVLIYTIIVNKNNLRTIKSIFIKKLNRNKISE